MKNNILLLSAGRRVELVKIIQNTLRNHNHIGELICADLHPEFSAACQYNGKYVNLPKINTELYLEALLKKVEENYIKVIIPTIDTEIDYLKDYIALFETLNCHLILSDTLFVEQCRDKRLTKSLIESHESNFTELYPANALQFPCYAKPYNGSRSINNYILHSRDDLTAQVIKNDNLIYTKLYGPPHQEYTIDAYYSNNSKLICAVPRKRIEVRTGEVSKSITARNKIYDYFISHFQHLKGAKGPINIQLFHHPDSGDIIFFEINPRFGGGYPLTFEAGANYVDLIIQERIYQNPINFYDGWSERVMMLRYDAHCIVRNA